MSYIYASGAFHHAISDQLPELKDTVKASCGKHVRRIDRFIQLALIGSHRCMQGRTPALPCSLYLSSGDGPKSNTITALRQVFLHNEALMPLQFINLVSNAAAFYIGQALALQGGSLFLSSSSFAIDKAMQLAALDLADGSCQQALVGCVDECADPIHVQREMLGLADDAAVGEGSYWFLLGNDAGNAIARIRANVHFADRASADAWLQQHGRADCVAPGKGIADAAYLAAYGRPWHYQQQLAAHNSSTGYALDAFLHDASLGNSLLHIDCSKEGHYQLLLVERLAG